MFWSTLCPTNLAQRNFNKYLLNECMIYYKELVVFGWLRQNIISFLHNVGNCTSRDVFLNSPVQLFSNIKFFKKQNFFSLDMSFFFFLKNLCCFLFLSRKFKICRRTILFVNWLKTSSFVSFRFPSCCLSFLLRHVYYELVGQSFSHTHVCHVLSQLHDGALA